MTTIDALKQLMEIYNQTRKAMESEMGQDFPEEQFHQWLMSKMLNREHK